MTIEAHKCPFRCHGHLTSGSFVNKLAKTFSLTVIQLVQCRSPDDSKWTRLEGLH